MTFYIGSLKRRRIRIAKLLASLGFETPRGSWRRYDLNICPKEAIRVIIPGVYGGKFYETIRLNILGIILETDYFPSIREFFRRLSCPIGGKILFEESFLRYIKRNVLSATLLSPYFSIRGRGRINENTKRALEASKRVFLEYYYKRFKE